LAGIFALVAPAMAMATAAEVGLAEALGVKLDIPFSAE
jgi:hypothetical protein